MGKIKFPLELIDNALLSREALFSQLTENGKDINKECGYPDTISVKDYKAMYDREGIATRVVEVLSQESWATDPEITENEEADETDFERIVKELDDEKRVFHYLARADEMSGIGSFGILFIGVDDGKKMHEEVEGVEGFERPAAEDPTERKPRMKLDTELASGNGKPKPKKDVPATNAQDLQVSDQEHELLFMRVFDRSLVDILTFERDETNPRFGQPTMYSVTFADENSDQGMTSVSNDSKKKVHWTRVIHFADNRKSSEVFGVPRQQAVYNRLVDLRKLLGGSAEMFWKGAFPGYSFEVDGDAADIEIDKDSMRLEFEKYSAGLQRYLALAGVSAKSLAPQVANPQAHVQAELEAIAITLGVPVRIFTGSEQAHLASTTDETTWNRRVTRRRKTYLTPYVIRPLFDRFMAMGIIPAIAKYNVAWEDLNSPSDSDRAEIIAKLTDALVKYAAGGADQLIPPREYLTRVWKLDPEEVDEILLAAEEVIAEEELKADEERELMQERAEALGMQATTITKEGGASFGQPPLPPVVGPPPNQKKPAVAKK